MLVIDITDVFQARRIPPLVSSAGRIHQKMDLSIDYRGGWRSGEFEM
jgi:hypothetical protein